MKRYRSFLSPVLRPCAGVLCERHERCSRYLIVDGTHLPSAHWLANCRLADGTYAAFVDAAFVGPPKPQAFAMTRMTLRHLQAQAFEVVA